MAARRGKNEARAACSFVLRLRSGPTLVPRFGPDPAEPLAPCLGVCFVSNGVFLVSSFTFFLRHGPYFVCLLPLSPNNKPQGAQTRIWI